VLKVVIKTQATNLPADCYWKYGCDLWWCIVVVDGKQN